MLGSSAAVVKWHLDRLDNLGRRTAVLEHDELSRIEHRPSEGVTVRADVVWP